MKFKEKNLFVKVLINLHKINYVMNFLMCCCRVCYQKISTFNFVLVFKTWIGSRRQWVYSGPTGINSHFPRDTAIKLLYQDQQLVQREEKYLIHLAIMIDFRRDARCKHVFAGVLVDDCQDIHNQAGRQAR